MSEEKYQALRRRLQNRHLQMIALGGAIGTGLFYGSAETIALTGPSVILSYLLGGVVIFFIMRMLGEMAVDEPVSGSFSYYAGKYWGAFPSFLSGWNYWFNYVIVSMAELTAVLLNRPEPFPDNFQNLWANGGFFPYGAWGFALSAVVVMFSFGGIELIGITAGETADPSRTIPAAIHQVIWRILLFYVGTMVVLMSLWPWDKVGLQTSPFVQIFEQIGIPAAAHILNVVVLTAAISVYNSAIYSNSRMLYGLAKAGNAPAFLLQVSQRGVPVYGILISSGSTLLVVAVNYFLPQEAFMYFLAVAVAAAVISWVTIAVTHLKVRRWCAANGHTVSFSAPFFPWINYLCLAFFAGILFFMTQLKATRLAVIILPLWLFLLAIGYRFYKKGST